MPQRTAARKGLSAPSRTHTLAELALGVSVSVLAVHTVYDELLSAIAPLGLAAAAGTALVVDLDSPGLPYPGQGSLANLVREGPRRDELEPSRPGVAILRNGGVDPREAFHVVEALTTGWPAVVLRSSSENGFDEVPTLVVIPLYPGLLAPEAVDHPVYQKTSFPVSAPSGGIVLHRPSVGLASRLLRGTAPGPARWIRAWKAAWQWA